MENLKEIIRELEHECRMKADYILELEEEQRQDRGEISDLRKALLKCANKVTKRALIINQLDKAIKIQDYDGKISKHEYDFIVARWFRKSPFYENEPGVFIQPMRMIGVEGDEYIYAFANKYNYELRDIQLEEVDDILNMIVEDIGDETVIDGRF